MIRYKTFQTQDDALKNSGAARGWRGRPSWQQSGGKIGVLRGISYLTTFGGGKLQSAPGATESENKILRNCCMVCKNYQNFWGQFVWTET